MTKKLVVKKKLAPSDKRSFLETLSASGNLSSSAGVIGFTPSVISNARKTDPQFDEACRIALSKANLELEQEARRRALHGVVRKKYYRDQEIGEEIEYSDKLLMFLMQSSDPERFGNKKAGNTNVSIKQNISSADADSTLSKLGSFLNIEINTGGNSSVESDGGDIYDGEYEDIDSNE